MSGYYGDITWGAPDLVVAPDAVRPAWMTVPGGKAAQGTGEVLDEPVETTVEAEEPVVADMAATGAPVVKAVPAGQAQPGRLEYLWSGIKRNKVALAAGAVTIASMVVGPVDQTIKTLGETAAYVGPGMLAAEAAWIGGAAMMLAAIGKKVINPFKIRSRFKEIPEAAANSSLFKAGLAINTVAALAEFAIPTYAVTTNLPIESWGVLAFSSLDLWATVALRKIIWNGMHRKQKQDIPEV